MKGTKTIVLTMNCKDGAMDDIHDEDGVFGKT